MFSILSSFSFVKLSSIIIPFSFSVLLSILLSFSISIILLFILLIFLIKLFFNEFLLMISLFKLFCLLSKLMLLLFSLILFSSCKSEMSSAGKISKFSISFSSLFSSILFFFEFLSFESKNLITSEYLPCFINS